MLQSLSFVRLIRRTLHHLEFTGTRLVLRKRFRGFCIVGNVLGSCFRASQMPAATPAAPRARVMFGYFRNGSHMRRHQVGPPYQSDTWRRGDVIESTLSPITIMANSSTNRLWVLEPARLPMTHLELCGCGAANRPLLRPLFWLRQFGPPRGADVPPLRGELRNNWNRRENAHAQQRPSDAATTLLRKFVGEKQPHAGAKCGPRTRDEGDLR